jgi:hypothetical protein
MSVLAVRNGISEDEFKKRAYKFFKTDSSKTSNSEKYNAASLSGYAKPDLVQTRMNELSAALGL